MLFRARAKNIFLRVFYIYIFFKLYLNTVLNTKRVENIFQSLDIFSVMVHAIEIQNIPT